MLNKKFITGLLIAGFITACNNVPDIDQAIAAHDSSISCMSVPSRFGINQDTSSIQFSGDTSVAGMVLIPAGIFQMGGDNEQAGPDEYPKHKVQVSAFYMDVT